MDSSRKGLVMRNAFPWYDIFMKWNKMWDILQTFEQPVIWHAGNLHCGVTAMIWTIFYASFVRVRLIEVFKHSLLQHEKCTNCQQCPVIQQLTYSSETNLCQRVFQNVHIFIQCISYICTRICFASCCCCCIIIFHWIQMIFLSIYIRVVALTLGASHDLITHFSESFQTDTYNSMGI